MCWLINQFIALDCIIFVSMSVIYGASFTSVGYIMSRPYKL